MSNLIRCSTCKRHIYASESSCPFCARASATTSGSVAVALTAAASIALAGCANDPPKKDPETEVAPETRKIEATQTAPNPAPPPALTPTPAPTPEPPPDAAEPAPVPSASLTATPTKPAPTTTNTSVNPGTTAVPAYGLPRPTVGPLPTKPRPAAYGGPPPTKKQGDPLF